MLQRRSLGAQVMTDHPQLVFGHFRVATHPNGSPVELGRGAMGVTYKAFDERLRIDVALKIIAPNQIDNPKAQTSFLREARAAARVHHSNVASVVYLNDTPGNFFYAMEFVEGESLRDWMRSRKVSPPETVISLGIQIARGLEAIHEQHLVHRDLKPANVMLVKAQPGSGRLIRDSDPDSWRAKIIDFGLARATSLDGARGQAATHTAGFHGTALYASPEQCEERNDLDGRSDFYSLGCILWEMLCGAPPFRARTHRELMNQHVAEPLPVERMAHLPPSLAAVVARLLIKDPANRFPNAASLIRALEHGREKLQRGEETSGLVDATTYDPSGAAVDAGAGKAPSSARPAAPSSTTGGSRRELWIAAAAVLALLLPGWFFFARKSPEAARSAAAVGSQGEATPGSPATARPASALRQSIAVLPFANLTLDKANEFFADGVQEDILTNLTKIRALKVISRFSTLKFRDPAGRNLREIAGELGVGTILEGSVRRDGERVKVTAQLIDADTAQILWTDGYDRKLTDIFKIQSDVAIAIANALETNLAPAERTELTRAVSVNPAAYALYVEARGADLSDSRNVNAAVAALQAAVDADPNFALAHAQLSIVLSMVADWGRDREKRQALAASSAETALRLQPDLPEAQLAMAVYAYRVLRNPAQAQPFFQRALAAMPGNADVLFEFAGMERRLGNWSDAAAKYERVAEMAPLDPFKQYAAANTYTFMRRYEDAWRILEPALRRLPDSAYLKVLKGQLFLAWKNDLGPMRDDIARRSHSVPDPEGYVYDKVLLLLFERKFDEALATLRDSQFSVMEGQVEYVTRDALEAEILTEAGRTSEASVVWRRAANALAKMVAEQPDNARIRMAYALALAGRSDVPEEAMREARMAVAAIPVEKDAMDGPFLQAKLALVYLRTGHRQEAAEIVARVRRIPSIEYDSMFNLSPAWDALRQDKPQK